MIDILHARGPNACGEVAFHYRYRPKQGTAMNAADVVLLGDLGPAVDGTRVVCGACGYNDGPAAFIPDGGWGMV